MTKESIGELWKRCEAERMKVLDDARSEAEKWKREGDMYGWNFHQGIASGTIAASFIYGRVFKSFRSPCQWQYDSTNERWDTSCGTAFWIDRETPAAEDFHFCPNCGGRIEPEE